MDNHCRIRRALRRQLVNPSKFPDAAYNNTANIRFGFDAALKARVRILRPTTGVYAQVGIGANGLLLAGFSTHYALGFEFGLFDRMALYGQAKKFINIEDEGVFLSLGISINATSENLRRRYDLEN